MKNSFLKKILMLIFMVSGITEINAQNWTTYTSTEVGIDGGIYSILNDQYNDLWFGSWTNSEGTNGLSNYWGSDGNESWWYIGAGGLIGDHVRAIIQDSSATYWFGTTTGVTRFNFNTGVINYTTAEGLVDDYILSIIQDTDGNIWFGTAGGVSKFDGTAWTNYTTDDNVGLYNISSIIQDTNGDFWFGSISEGVIKFDGTTWTNYTTEDGLVSNNVYVVFQDSDENFWFATYSGEGLSKFDGTTWTTYTTADGLSHNKVRVITQDSFGDLWFGTNAGLSRFNGTSWTTYTTADGLIPGGVRAITQDNNDDLWIGTWSAGLSKFEISKVHIPDLNFEQSLIDIGIDVSGILDGVILRSEALAVTDLNLTNPLFQNDGFENPLITTVTGKIADLTGIEAFENLTSLQLGNGDLTNVDISKNTKLDNLFFNDNLLTSIDVSNNTLLKRLGIMRNPGIGTLNVSNNLLLEELFVSETALTNIDVSSNASLWKFYGRWGNLTGIDLSQNSNLRDVKLRGSSNLTYFNVKNGNNSNVTGFDVRDMPSLTCITADGISETEVSALMLGYSNGLLSTNCGTVYIPDSNFENYLETHDVNGIEVTLGDPSSMGDGVLNHLILRSDAETVTSLNVGSSSITDVTGIEAFTGLTALAIYDNQISTIDLSNNTLLEDLYFNDNQISSLDLTYQNNLSFLNIDRNDTEELILGNHPNLSVILGSGNAINSIDVTNCPSLITLSLGGSRLTSLDLIGNEFLEEIVVHWNLLSELDISANPNVSFLLCEGNQLTSLNIANGNNLNFIIPESATYTDYSFNALNNNNLECIQVDVDAYSNIPTDWIKEASTIYSIDCATKPEYVYIPDANFEIALIDLEMDSDEFVNSFILKSDAELVEELNLNVEALAASHSYGEGTGNPLILNVTEPISDLTGIEAFTSLINLSCGYHAISEVDVSSLVNLERLDLANNNLLSIDISNLSNLEWLDVIQNQISGIDLSNNSLLEIIWLENNLFTTIDVSHNINLLNLAIGVNPLSSLDVSNNSALRTLTAEATQIPTLDLSENVNLRQLWLADNTNLGSVNLYNNPLLFNLGIYNTSIITLDLSNNNIERLYANNNPSLEHLDLRNGNNLNVETFNIGNTPNLICINADGNTLTEISQVMIDSGKTFSEDCGDFVYIPDASFEQELIDLEIDSDGVVNTSILRLDAEGVNSELNVSNSSITDLTGIEAFIYIETLSIQNNQISELILSSNSELVDLRVWDNQLTNLDLSDNPNFKYLYADDNDISTISFATTNLVERINLRNNPISNLLVNSYSNLIQMDIAFTNINSLDISQNLNLEELYIVGNGFTSLDITDNQSLAILKAQNNSNLILLSDAGNDSLTVLNLSGTGLNGSYDPFLYPNLEYLYLNNNEITRIVTNSIESIKNLYINNNSLRTLKFRNNEFLEILKADNNELTNLDLRNNNNNNILTTVNVIGNLLTCINVDNPDDLSMPYNLWNYDFGVDLSVNCNNEEPVILIPDENFENKLISLGYDTNGFNGSILQSEAEGVYDLDVSSSNILDFTGIEGFISLINLDCSNNLIPSVNLENSLNIETLDASNNLLASMLLGAHTQLSSVNVSSNDLIELNVINGNNSNILFFDATINPNLYCIGVDSSNSIPANWFKDPIANYTNSSDCVSPVIVAQSQSLSLRDNGTAVVNANIFDNGSYDNVTTNNNLIFTVNVADFDCSNIGVNILELTVTDEAGNSSTETVELTLRDDTPPEVTAKGSFEYDLNGAAAFTLNPLDVTRRASDNCGEPTLSVSPSTFSTTGVFSVTLTAVDGFGNSSEDYIDIEVIDGAVSFTNLNFRRGLTVTVYPVPFTDVLNLDFSRVTDLNTVNVELYDFNMMLTSIQFNPDNGNLISNYTGSLLPGVYIIQIIVNGQTRSATIIKN